MNRPFSSPQFDARDLLEFLNTALYLLGLGGLITKAVDEGFELLNPFALIAVSRFQLIAALLLLRQIFLVVAAVEMYTFVPDLDGLADGDIQKIAVVRNQDVGKRITGQGSLQPIARFQ